MSFYKYLMVVMVCGLMQCGPVKLNNNTNQVFEKSEGTGIDLKTWNCFEIGDDHLCCPSTWRSIKQTDYYYLSNLDKSGDNTSFLILRYDITPEGLNPRVYLKEGYSQMLRDTINKFTGYTVQKLTFQDSEVYYSEFFSERSNKQYLTYSMMFEKDNYLYDFCLKAEKNESSHYKDTLRNILLTFKVKGEQVFDYEDEIIKTDTVDISKL